MKKAERLQNLAPYLFAQLEAKISDAKKQGIDVINLGIGDPDLPTPKHIVAELQAQAETAANHQYPTSVGMESLRQSVANWYKRRYGVQLDPISEVAALIGSKEGIAHLPFCYLNPGDVGLVPDPGYPVYQAGITLAGGQCHFMPLKAENGFLPILSDIPTDVCRQAKLMYINYPNNPTGAIATRQFFHEVVAFAKEYNVLIAHDAAYLEVGYDGYEPLSFMQVPGAKDVGIEFGSPSKSHNMTGWRIGWVVGHSDVVKTLVTLKSNIDSGAFQAVQYGAMIALDSSQDALEEQLAIYKRRRDIVIEALTTMGWQLGRPQASIYIWAPTPNGMNSIEFADHVFSQTGVVITPGIGYGAEGDRYFRISLTVDEARLQEAMDRLVKSNINFMQENSK